MTPIIRSLQVPVIASIIVLILSLCCAWFMVRWRFKGQLLIETVLMLPLVLPPSVIGFLLLIGLGRRSPIGWLIEFLFGRPVLFTVGAAIIAATVVALPLVYQMVKIGLLSVDPEIAAAARVDGADERRVFLYITLPIIKPTLFTAYLLGFSRALGEFGATLMIAGNIPGRTQTIPTAIYIATDAGQMALAWSWTVVVILLSFAMLFYIRGKQMSNEHTDPHHS